MGMCIGGCGRSAERIRVATPRHARVTVAALRDDIVTRRCDHPAIHVSYDHGANWTGIPADFAVNLQVNKVAYANGYLYAGNSEGLFRLDFRTWSGVKEPMSASLVKVSPNPTLDRSTITLTEGAPSITHMSLVDGSGRVVMQRYVARNAPLGLDLGSTPPGTYQLLLKHAEGTIRKSVVVAR